jgi:hypothetical protein
MKYERDTNDLEMTNEKYTSRPIYTSTRRKDKRSEGKIIERKR